MISGILHENSNVLLEHSINCNIEEYDDGYNSILSEDGSNCDTKDSEFVNRYETAVEEDYEKNFSRDDWEWDKWTPIGDDDAIHDFYNVINVLKPKIAACFDTIIQCVFECT